MLHVSWLIEKLGKHFRFETPNLQFLIHLQHIKLCDVTRDVKWQIYSFILYFSKYLTAVWTSENFILSE